MDWDDDLTRWILTGLAAFVVVSGCFVLGVRWGVAIGERIEAGWLSSISTSQAAARHGTLRLLDARDYRRLREESNVELDADLLVLCVALERAEPGQEQAARTLVRTIAEYRRAVPPTYPADRGPGPGREWARARVEACLTSALAGPSR